MNYKHYVVKFKNGITVFTSCFNAKEAQILAMAKIIKNGYEYAVDSIKQANLVMMTQTDLVA